MGSASASVCEHRAKLPLDRILPFSSFRLMLTIYLLYCTIYRVPFTIYYGDVFMFRLPPIVYRVM